MEDQFTEHYSGTATLSTTNQAAVFMKKQSALLPYSPEDTDTEDTELLMTRLVSNHGLFAPSISLLPLSTSHQDGVDMGGYHQVPNVGVPSLSRLGSGSGPLGGDETIADNEVRTAVCGCWFDIVQI